MSERAIAQQQNTNTSKRILSNAVNFQRQAVNHDELTALPEWKLDTLSGDFAEPRIGYDFSRVPALTGMAQKNLPILRTQPMIQRSSKDGSAGSAPCATCLDDEFTPISAPTEPTAEPTSLAPEATPTTATPEPEEESAVPVEATVLALLVEDSATELAPGQMRKSEFLVQLRVEVTRAAEAAMAGTGRTTADCPYLNFWFGYYSLRDSTHIERAIHRYAPETASVTTARGYIPIIVGRVRRAVDTWVSTGEVTGVPEGVPTTVPGAGGGGEGAAASSGPIMAKARDGGVRSADNPQAIQAELGQGRPLDSGVRSRMESAFGMDFSQVRTHTDTTAASLSNRLNARAFTVGKHVAFGSGEYRPGTLIGDALIAHEMAHVVQQSGAGDSVAHMQTGEASYNTLENDADKSALGAVTSFWGGLKGVITDIAQNVIPSLRSGLRLQRCKEDGCVTGNLTAKTSGTLQGGWSVHDYLRGTSWGHVIGPKTAGRDRTGFKVQIVGPYSGKENLGVSQSLKFDSANQAFLDSFAAYSGRPPGSIKNNTVYNEPVLDASNPFAVKPWFLRYKDGKVSFADVPRNSAGRKGNCDFTTCFYSKGAKCANKKCCVVWRWSIDFTPGNSINNVTQQSQSCS